jgi:hypothetical protein
MGEDALSPSPARRMRGGRLLPAGARRFLHSHWPVLVLVALPVAAFGLPAVANHLVIGEDNLIQSYPLRQLVGDQIRHGHLPLWNPYIWSGTPLLAGYNAGAAFPLTWLFVALPPKPAWALTEIATYAASSLGLYAFLRLHDLRRGAAVLGAVTFTWGGFMSSQLVHIDLVQGVGLVPWVLVAIRQVATDRDRPWRWAGLLAGSLGLILLTGAPAALVNALIVAAIYGLHTLWRHRDRALAILLCCAVGAGAGVLLGAAQLLPGLAFTSQSQRGAATLAFFSTGSLPPPLLILALVPYLLGGFGRLGVPDYFGGMNLAEVSTYVGFLPLIAALWLLTRRFRRHPGSRDWWVWYAVIAVSVVLSLGTETPVGHLAFHIPLYNAQRLQNRYLAGADLGLAVLFAFWADRITGSAEALSARLRSRVLPLLPAAGVVAIFVLFFAWGTGFVRALGATNLDPILRSSMKPYMAITLAIALLATAVGCFYDRVPPRRRMQALAVLTAIDLGFFTLYQSWLAFQPSSVVDVSTPQSRQLAREVGSSRFAIYNPELYDYDTLLDLGQPDLNVTNRAPSSQGYGSVVSATYQEATGAHDQSTLYPVAIRGSALDKLDTTLLLSRLEYFATQLNPPQPPQPLPPPSITSTIPPPPLPPPLPPLEPGGQRTFYLGTLAEVSGVTVPTASGSGPERIGIRTATGAVAWPSATTAPSGTEVRARFEQPQLASAVVVQNLGARSISPGTLTVATDDLGRLRLDGVLQDIVQPPHWRFSGMIGEYAVFRNTRAKGPFWLAPDDGRSPAGATARLLFSSETGAQSYSVRSPVPVDLVRSVAFEPGWTATIDGSGARHVPVQRDGAIQSVRVPPGDHTVTFAYRPATALAGIALSAAAVFAGAVVACAAALTRRRSTARAQLEEPRGSGGTQK